MGESAESSDVRIARLDERIAADRELRVEWRTEISRRLESLNQLSSHYSAQATSDRERFLTKEAFEARHAELGTRIETSLRELAVKMAEGSRQSARDHGESIEKIGKLQQFEANIRGRLIATAAISATLTAIAALILRLFSKL